MQKMGVHSGPRTHFATALQRGLTPRKTGSFQVEKLPETPPIKVFKKPM
jgi:hypothetical protein